MINAPFDKEFVFHDGKRAKNFIELKDCLESLNFAEFSEFVNDYKNDFANWIEYVLMDKEFADKLRKIKSKEESLILLDRKINESLARRHPVNVLVNPQQHHTVVSHLQDEHGDVHTSVHTDSGVHHMAGSSNYDSAHAGMHHIDAHHADTNHLLENKSSSKVLSSLSSDKDNAQKDPKEHARKWFHMFSKKMNEKKIEDISNKQTDKFHAEHLVKEQMHENKAENMFWVILYVILILAIIALLVYKFVIMK